MNGESPLGSACSCQKMRSGSRVPHDTSLAGHVPSQSLGTFLCDTRTVLPVFHRLVRSTPGTSMRQWFSELVLSLDKQEGCQCSFSKGATRGLKRTQMYRRCYTKADPKAFTLMGQSTPGSRTATTGQAAGGFDRHNGLGTHHCVLSGTPQTRDPVRPGPFRSLRPCSAQAVLSLASRVTRKACPPLAPPLPREAAGCAA